MRNDFDLLSILLGNDDKNNDKKDDNEAGEQSKEPKSDDGGFLASLAKPPVNHDLLFVQLEGRIRKFRGEVLGSDKAGLLIELAGEKQTFSLARIYGVVFGELAGLEERPEGSARTIVRFRGG